MLVLRRKHGESIVIELPGGQQIVITNLGQSAAGGIRIGITCPREINIRRSEIASEAAR